MNKRQLIKRVKQLGSIKSSKEIWGSFRVFCISRIKKVANPSVTINGERYDIVPNSFYYDGSKEDKFISGG